MTGKELKGDDVVILLNDGKPRPLIYDFNAICEVEAKLGGIAELNSLNMAALKNVRMLVWAGIMHLEEGLTELEVGKLIPLGNTGNITNAITKALKNAFPEKKSEAPAIPKEN